MSEEDPVRWSDASPPPELLALVRDASRPPPLPPVLRASMRASVLRAARPLPLRPPFAAGLAVVVVVAIGIVIWRVLPIDPGDRRATVVSEPATETNPRAIDEPAPSEIAPAPAERVVLGEEEGEGARAVVRRVGGGAPGAIEPAPLRRPSTSEAPRQVELAAGDAPTRVGASPRRAREAPAGGSAPLRGGSAVRQCNPFTGQCVRPPPSSLPPAAPRELGTLTVQTIPWARVFLDGQDTGRNTPIRELRVPAGRHRLGLRGADGVMRTMEIVIVAGQRLRIVRQL